MTERIEESRFLASLGAEKLQAQERRGKLVAAKLAWVTGLFSLGALKLPIDINSQVLLFLVPIVALVYDLYIIGENYGIKRMGAFVRGHASPSLEVKWECWLAPRRDRFSWYALPLSSFIILTVCAALLFNTSSNRLLLAMWCGVLSFVMLAVYLRSAKILRELDDFGRERCDDK